MVKNLLENSGDTGSILGLGKSPGEENGNLLQDFLPGKFHRQKSLVGGLQSMGLQRIGHD